MPLPNFLIIGAAKAGTSSLYYYLKQHPQVFMSAIKEPKFFALEGEPLDYKGPDQGINKNSVNNIDDYQKLFEGATNELAIGEASPMYLTSHKAPENIKRYIPNVKLIAILRNPVDRAFSSYTHLIREDLETLPFEAAIEAEPKRIADKWSHLFYYTQNGYYASQIKSYLDMYDHENIKVYLYEDLVKDTPKLVDELYEFLQIDRGFSPDLSKRNVSGVPKSRLVHNMFRKDNILKDSLKLFLPKEMRRQVAEKVLRKNLGAKPKLEAPMRRQLISLYRDDITHLQDILHRDLSDWLTVAS